MALRDSSSVTLVRRCETQFLLDLTSKKTLQIGEVTQGWAGTPSLVVNYFMKCNRKLLQKLWKIQDNIVPLQGLETQAVDPKGKRGRVVSTGVARGASLSLRTRPLPLLLAPSSPGQALGPWQPRPSLRPPFTASALLEHDVFLFL